MADYATLGSLRDVIADLPWPVDFFAVDDLPAFLDKIFVLDHAFANTATGYEGFLWLAIEKELSVKIPGLKGVSVVAGDNLGDLTFFTIRVEIGDKNTFKLVDTELALSYEGSLLRPVPTPEESNPESVDLSLSGTVVLDDSFNVTFEEFDSVDLSPAMIGETGVIISAKDVS